MAQGHFGTTFATFVRYLGAVAMSAGPLDSAPCGRWAADSLRALVTSTWAAPASRLLDSGI